MSKRWRTFLNVFVVLFTIGFSACTGQAAPQPLTQTPQPTQTSRVELNSSADFPDPTYKSTQKPTGTFTPRPSPSDTPTQDVQATLTEQADALEITQIASFSPTCNQPNSEHTSISPKGNWLAISCGNKSDQSLQIYSKTGKKWELLFQDYVDKELIRLGGTPPGYLYPVHWTKDEKYLYFISSLSYDSGGDCFFYGNGQGLYRLDVDNGTVSTILSLLTGDFRDYAISFSPNGRWLVYSAGRPAILDLQTGDKILFPNKRESAGDFTWSPDSSSLAYASCRLTEDFSRIKESSIRIFSLDTRNAETILETESGFLRISTGSGDTLRIRDDFNNDWKDVYFDWSSQQVITATATPALGEHDPGSKR